VQQVEMLVDHVAIPSSSITTTVSLSEGMSSHNNANGGHLLNEEVNQHAVGIVEAPLGARLNNLQNAYPSDDETEDGELIPNDHNAIVPLVANNANNQEAKANLLAPEGNLNDDDLMVEDANNVVGPEDINADNNQEADVDINLLAVQENLNAVEANFPILENLDVPLLQEAAGAVAPLTQDAHESAPVMDNVQTLIAESSVNVGLADVNAELSLDQTKLGENGSPKVTIINDVVSLSKPVFNNSFITTLAEQHAHSIINGSHLMSEEGIDLWV
jgi:hypothetical protein